MSNLSRFVLRFFILYEFYKAEHATTKLPFNLVNPIINDIDESEGEKLAAKRYLVDSNLVNGSNNPTGDGILPDIIRINNHGIDFVENIVHQTDFSCIKDEIGNKIINDGAKRKFLDNSFFKFVGKTASKTGECLVIELAKNANQLLSSWG